MKLYLQEKLNLESFEKMFKHFKISAVLDLGTRWRQLVSLMTYERHSRSGPYAVQKKKILAPQRNRTPAVKPVARHCTN
jgi:hypothetical protein